jgi:hypothetical protein
LKILTLFGALPPPLGHPHRDDEVLLLPNSDYRNAPRPPTGDWWRKRGHYFIKKKGFLQPLYQRFKKTTDFIFPAYVIIKDGLMLTRA